MKEGLGEVFEHKRGVLVYWRWLQWPVLVVLVIVSLCWLQGEERQSSQEEGRQQREVALKIASDQQREAVLLNYIDTISDLLVHDKLLQAQNADVVKVVAHARTLETLRVVDGKRKARLLVFLNETKLINNDYHIIDLADGDGKEADLRGVDLRDSALTGYKLKGADARGANLSYATLLFVDFSGANLAGADLHASDMHNVDLTNTHLEKANLKDVTGLSSEQLSKVRSLAGAIMPDGTIHQ